VRKNILPASTYDKIKDQITARRTTGSSSDADTKAKEPTSAATDSTAATETTKASTASSRSPASSRKSEQAGASEKAEDESETQAKTPPAKGMVWVNLKTGIYHREGDRWYGKTKSGKFMSEGDAEKAGYKPAKNGPKSD
jgi:hypothetical protein